MNGVGITGERIPYLLNGDEWITGILVLCFLMTSYVLSHGRSMLFQSIRMLFSNHGIDHRDPSLSVPVLPSWPGPRQDPRFPSSTATSTL